MAQNACTVCGLKMNSSSMTHLEISKSNHLSQLWTYVYHQYVQQAVTLPEIETNSCQQSGVPKLTFVLSVTNPTAEKSGANNKYPFCGRCCKELATLERMHEDLEQYKKTVERQVSKIFKLEQKYATNIKNQVANSGGQSSLQIAFAGASVGVGNIGKTIKFLEIFCKGMMETQQQNSTSEKFPMARETVSDYGTRNINSCESQETISSPEQELSNSESYNLITDESQHDESSFVNESEFEEGPITITTVKSESGFEMELEESKPPIYSPSSILPSSPHSSSIVSAKMPTAGTKSQSKSSYPSKNTLKECEICGKLILAGNLPLHVRRHKGIKPHKCEYCGFTCATRSGVITHQKKRHMEQLEMDQGMKDPLAI